MADTIDFPRSNIVWRGWEAKGQRQGVDDLHAYRDLDADPNTDRAWTTISCWQLSNDEMAEIAKTGRVWLYVMGGRHPPVAVSGTDPFKRTAEDPGRRGWR